MNLINKKIIVIFVLTFSICEAQNINQDEALITGTWVAEGSSINDKLVFSNDGIIREYTNNSLDVTYNWSISSSTNSGVTSQYIELTNIADNSDKYKYEISIVNEERFVLIYQRKNQMGIGKPIIYIRQ